MEVAQDISRQGEIGLRYKTAPDYIPVSVVKTEESLDAIAELGGLPYRQEESIDYEDYRHRNCEEYQAESDRSGSCHCH